MKKQIQKEYCEKCKKETKNIKQGFTILNFKVICFECGIIKYEGGLNGKKSSI